MLVFEQMLEVLAGAQTEVIIFVVAVCVHLLLFGQRRPQGPSKQRQRVAVAPVSQAQVREGPSREATILVKAVRPLLKENPAREILVSEIDEKLQKVSDEDSTKALVGMLEALGRSTTRELIAAVREFQAQRSLAPDARLSEMVLRGHLALGQQEAFTELLQEAVQHHGTHPGISLLALKAALRAGDFEAALLPLEGLAASLREVAGTPSAAPQQMLQLLVQLAADKAELPKLTSELKKRDVFVPWIVEALLKECAKREDIANLKACEEQARKQGVELTAQSYCMLLRVAPTGGEALALLEEAAKRGLAGRLPLLLGAAEAAETRSDAPLATAVLDRFADCPAPQVAAALLRLAAAGVLGPKGASPERALLTLYEESIKNSDVLVVAGAGRLVAEAALKLGRPDLLKRLVSETVEASRVALLMKGFGTEKRLADVFAIFEACPSKTGVLYNTLLDACVDNKDGRSAERIFAEAVAAGVADVVTYNTAIKAHVQSGDFRRARAGIETMRAAGLVPNHVTFHELIDAEVRAGRDSWAIVEEMKACGLRPNQVTCSILLKGVQPNSRSADVERTMAIVATLEDEMDEVLLSSVCEACIRCKRTDLLRKQLTRQRSNHSVQVNGAYTFGSIIRGHGFLGDLAGVWSTWSEMRSRNVVPTSTTIGCMVEALVTNDGPEAGYELIRELLDDPKLAPLVNAIIYCSVLKGFCHQKSFDRVWTVYKEMRGLELQFSLVTYNTLIDACARCRQVDRVPTILDEMAGLGIKPNVITYSTILKGYCQENRLDKAFELLEQMKRSPTCRPDDFTYNTLLDGCACQGLYNKGVSVLDDMQRSGVRPSNFTLSLAAKLGNRGGTVDQAFHLCEDLAKRHGLRWNVHVYDNLIHACTAHKELRRAILVFERMLGEGVGADQRTYALLIRACISAGEALEVVSLVRAANGIQLDSNRFARFARHLTTVKGGLNQDLLTEALKATGPPVGDEFAAVQLMRDLRRVPGVKLDPKLPLQLTSQAIHCP